MTTSIRTSADGLSSIISINGVDKLTVDQNGKVTATKFAGDGSELSGLVKSGTAIATTSGTAHDFTGIPSWVKRITLSLSGVSTNGASDLCVRIGSGSLQTTGYDSRGSYGTNAFSNTTCFDIVAGVSAAGTASGLVTLVQVSGNTWALASCIGQVGQYSCVVGGNVTLAGVLDRLRLTTANGTDLFDAGSINILYE